MAKKYIAYLGDEFSIEWYFDCHGKSGAFEYFEALPADRKKKLVHLLYLLGATGKIFNIEKFRHEGDQIYVIKPASDRFFCFFYDGAKIIVTNAYEKKTKKMPPSEKARALKAKDDYIQRCAKGTYYD